MTKKSELPPAFCSTVCSKKSRLPSRREQCIETSEAFECSSVRYLVLVLNERPQFGLALAGRLLFALFGVGQAVLGHRPLHGLTVVFKLHVARGLKARLEGLHHLLRVLEGESGRTGQCKMFLFIFIFRNIQTSP